MLTKEKKPEHTGFRNGDLFCFHCGQSYKMNLPQPVDMVTAMMKQFAKTHKSCQKVWQEPVIPQDNRSERDKAAWWENHGEIGTSSATIFFTIMGRAPRGHSYGSHPYDPDDFRRCYGLIKTVPEWRPKLELMKPLSKTWSNLVDNWDKLTEMIEEQMATKKDNGMYDFMQKLGC